MNENEILVQNIIEGIQEKKGLHIRVADLSEIDDTICKYIVICEGSSPTQVSAIYESVRQYVIDHCKTKPTAVDGTRNNFWVAMDYVDVIVHIFLPEAREFYDIDHLWEDAKTTDIADIY
ncbi:MAG: ribosome silencing factor [Bacteroidaceae bacterium]|nr:ribosome silencing factor [Bacteroidaceae bacterium]